MKKRKKEIEKGLDSIIKTTKKDFKSWAEINTENYLKKNKITKEHSRSPFWIMLDEDRQKLREYSKKKYYNMSR